MKLGQKHTEEWKRGQSERMSGTNHPMYGKHHSCESKQKISIAKKGKIYNGMFTKGHRLNVGRKFSEEHKRKIGDAHRGKIISVETRKKLSDINKGKKLTEETKKKISESNKGHFVSGETKEKIGLANAGKNNGMFGKYWKNNPTFSTGSGAYVREFQRRGNKPICSKCGKQGRFAINSIHVHHKDGNRKNNSMDNLQAFCSMCHLHIHKNWEGSVYV